MSAFDPKRTSIAPFQYAGLGRYDASSRASGEAMRRREFITLVGGSAVAWPLALRAQQSGQMRRIGVLMPFARDNSEGQARVTAFVQGLQKLGWTKGRNICAYDRGEGLGILRDL